MINEVWLGKNTFRFWYYRFKDSPYYSLVLISSIILVCVILLFKVIIPQIEDWFSIRHEVIATQDRLKVLRSNVNYMNNIDRGMLDSQLHVATTALPTEKDFGNVLMAISDASIKSGIELEDYAFQVGDIGTASAKLVPDDKMLPTIKVTMEVDGSIDALNIFIKEIQKKLPLSEVTNVEADGLSTTLSIQFFQKPIKTIVFNDTDAIQPLQDSKRLLLQQLSGWQTTTVDTGPQTGTTSGVPLFEDSR